MFPVSV